MIEINGVKVTLKEPTIDELEKLYYWKFVEKEQEAKKWNGPYIPEGYRTMETYIKEWNETIVDFVPSSLAIMANDETIGSVGAYWVDKNTDWLEIGIVIYDKTYWNGGYGYEAFKLWVEYLFRSTNLHRLGLSTWSGNIRMMKVAEKLGMKEEARVREARIVNGKYYDAIKMGILRREWEGLL